VRVVSVVTRGNEKSERGMFGYALLQSCGDQKVSPIFKTKSSGKGGGIREKRKKKETYPDLKGKGSVDFSKKVTRWRGTCGNQLNSLLREVDRKKGKGSAGKNEPKETTEAKKPAEPLQGKNGGGETS